MSKPTEAEEKTSQYSLQKFRVADELEKNEAFGQYIAELQEQADELSEKVLEGEMPADVREALRIRRLGIVAAIRLNRTNRETHATILRGMDIEPA